MGNCGSPLETPAGWLLLTHGVDLQVWKTADSQADDEELMGQMAGPIMLFWGTIDQRMDVEILQRLAGDLPGRPSRRGLPGRAAR